MADFFTTLKIKRLSNLYSDFDKSLTVNPITNDLSVRLDEDSVKESIKNLILTDRGERLMQPEIGSDVRATLFENNTPITLKILQERIRSVINNYEPRAELIDVETTSNLDDTRIFVKIIFSLRNKELPIEVTVLLERLR